MSASKKETTPSFRGRDLISAANGTTRDVLTVLLNPDSLYTSDEVGDKLKNFMEKEV